VAEIQFDQNFLFAIRDRNANAESFLVSHFARPVRLKLRARLRSPELVEDACQETFLRVITYLRQGKVLNRPASLPGFVHSVCHNVALELLRNQTRQSQLTENAEDPIDSGPGPEGLMVSEERKRIVTRILNELPERDRQILRRVFLDEQDKDSICRDLKVDRDYLRVLLHRACARFRTLAVRTGSATGI
jgi:RNA polymerase sigma-70 factor (ECF subfamily)